MAKQSVGTRVNKASDCPNCGERQLVPIVYGYPSEFTMQLSQKGIVELGGCIVSGDDPSFRCGNCHHQIWRDGRTQVPRMASTADRLRLVDPGPGLTRVFRAAR